MALRLTRSPIKFIRRGGYDGSIAVIDGATNAATQVQVIPGGSSYAIAVNPVTNKIYTDDIGGLKVGVTDGDTNTTTLIYGVADGINRIVVNPVTNKIYAGNGSNTIKVVDGVTHSVSTVGVGSPGGGFGSYIAVNQTTNKIYVANSGSNSVTVIDGATHATTTVPVGVAPSDIAVNPATNRIYMPTLFGDGAAVIAGDSGYHFCGFPSA